MPISLEGSETQAAGLAAVADVRPRPTRQLHIERGVLVERGLQELAPKRPSYPKLAATTVRQLLDRTGNRPLAAATVLMPLAGHDAETTLALLPDVPRLTLGAPLFPTALDQLAGIAGRTMLVALGGAEPPTDDGHAALARALVTHDRSRERLLADRLLADGAQARSTDRLVVEERPGKAHALSLVQPSIKHAEQRWQPMRDRRDAAPLSTQAGWGLSGIVLSDHAEGNHQSRPVNVASLDVRFADVGLGFDAARSLRDLSTRWLDGLGVAPDSLRRVVVSAPWLAVSGFLGAALIAGDASRHPDQILGWQPLVTLLAFLAEPDVPALLVYTGRHPTVHLVAVWS